MSEAPKHEVKFVGFTKPYGLKPEDAVSQNRDNRPLLIRRIECPTCEFFLMNLFPFDDEGNVVPKGVCKLLDVDNAKIEQDNALRHPSEQLPYHDCKYGKIEDTIPQMPRNASDYVQH